MPFGPRLIGERVVLRDPLPGDVEARARLGRHAEITRMFGAPNPADRPMSVAEAEVCFAGLGAPGVADWIVESDGTFLGTAALHSFDDDRRTARYAVGFYDPERLGQGLGTETTALVLAHAFDALGLQTVSLAVLEFNERAIRCYRRCGFREVRRETDAAVVDGVTYDDLIMEVGR